MVELKKKWVKIDPWRGYYDYENSVLGGCFLAMNKPHNTEERERINKARKILRKNKIPFRVKTARTSNVFSTCYDVVVDRKNKSKAQRLLRGLV